MTTMITLERFQELEKRIAALEAESKVYKFTWVSPRIPGLETVPSSKWMIGPVDRCYTGTHGVASRNYSLAEILVTLLNAGILVLDETPAVPAKLKVTLCARQDPVQPE